MVSESKPEGYSRNYRWQLMTFSVHVLIKPGVYLRKLAIVFFIWLPLTSGRRHLNG